ncbi:MAG: HAMP domain-containing protein [Calditrichaceae bacterium]|nr:HAMP domain-containing protein [Calditrichaceae bacterium]
MVAVGVTAAIIIGVSAYFYISSQEKLLLTEVERHINQLSETVKYSTRFDMLANRRVHLTNIIHSIGEEPGIPSIRIMNKDGLITYSADTTSIGNMVDKNAEACYVCHTANEPLERLDIKQRSRIYRQHPDSSRIMGLINPIYNEPSCWEADCHVHPKEQTVLGVLDITIKLDAIDEKIYSAKINSVVMTALAILFLSAILGYLVKILLDKPIQSLVKATQNVASGNLNYSVESTSGDELGILAQSFNNMTKKLAEARIQLFQSDKMASMGRLAAGVAHEINNPLTGILTYSSFLLKRFKGDTETAKDLEVIVRETKRSREIVKGLLDFARQSIPKKNENNLNEIIERAVTVVENQLTIKKINLVKKLESNLPNAVVDTNQIQQVFVNLIVNASQAIERDGGTITVSTHLISLAPYGLKPIKSAVCPKGHNLMDEEIKIDGLPSVRVKAKASGNEGFINIDPVYGRNKNHYGINIKNKTIIDISCPKCDISLMDKKKTCPKCGAPVYRLEIPDKGFYEACVTKGGEWQHWPEVDKKGPQQFIEAKITDTGCGISAENLDKIFEPFFTTKGQKGTGLGLAVIWGILEKHDGTIKVESQVGIGTTFTVRLPAA